MASRTGVIDRIEGPMAVIVPESGEPFNIPKRQLPRGAREGSRVQVTGSTVKLLTEDEHRTGTIKNLMKALFK